MDPDVPVGLPLEYIVNHVFLPPKLPALFDTTIDVEVGLTKQLHDALNSFIDLLPEDVQDEWTNLPNMLPILLDDGNIGSPVRSFPEHLIGMTEGDILALHITQQNAGLVIRRQPNSYTFEFFELSATSKDVITTKGRLVRRFPGPAISVSDQRVLNLEFQKALTQCLTYLESTVLNDAQVKGHGSHDDTVSPEFATEWLSGLLRGIGAPFEVSRIYKRTRDDIIFGEGNFLPWRRSPRWTLLRVALQTSMMSSEGEHTRYKVFMIYFMATILDLAVQNEYPSDLLYFMLSKISRRVQKLGLAMPDDVPWADQANDFIMETMEDTRKVLVKRWSTIQRSADSAGSFRVSDLKKLKPRLDTTLALTNLRPFLQKLHSLQIEQPNEIEFEGKCDRRIRWRKKTTLPAPDLLSPGDDADLRLRLMDVEAWVSHSLDTWVEANKDEESLRNLAKLIQWYTSASSTAYTVSPEGFSVMVLTLLLFWIKLDNATISHYPILRKYDPGFPITLFDSLVLPKRHQMTQLRDVENYLLNRKSNASIGSDFLFGMVSSPSSLGAQYFDQSPSLQRLSDHIRKEAENNSNAKKEELKKEKRQYASLMAQSDPLTCLVTMQWFGRGRNKFQQEAHSPECVKCLLRKQATAMRIATYEHPLPTSEPEAKCVVFELELPKLIRSWRSTTYRILVDVLNPNPPTQGKPRGITLDTYSGLARYLKVQAERLQLTSSTKPISQTQRASQTVAEASQDSVCVPNNLSYALQDTKSQQLPHDYLGKYAIHERCCYRLPPGSYEKLQYAVSGTKHTPNEVISKQGAHHDGLTIHEVHAFTALRCGHRLQWLNIARELVSRTLDLGKEEVYLLLLQASSQAGPSALQQVSRDSHIELEEEAFGLDLLSALAAGLTAVESNWQGSVAALTFITLAARLLTVSLHESVRSRCLDFLQRARNVTVKWLRVVVQLLHDSSDEIDMAYLTIRALDLALICHSTFDIDARQLPSLLSSTENVAILIESATIVRDRWPVSEESLTTLTRELLRRFQRTSHTLELPLRERVVASSGGIDRAIQLIWPGYEPGIPWVAVERPNDRWLMTRTAGSETTTSATIHFNILTGSLLVNGRSLARLPREYEQHATYKRLFGNKILEVVPSTKGLYFETRSSIHGFQVHFALQENELIVRASQGLEVYEVIPSHVLENDFPRSLILNYVHWIHRGTMCIEWRPLETKWIPSSENWRISTPEDPKARNLVSKSRCLVEPESVTAEAVHRWLKPLESSSNINIYHDEETGETEVHLPRFNLDFILRKTGLESKQFRGMIVDTNQYLGCMHGLLHKLILKDTKGSSRVVIIPHGAVHFHRTEHHVQVSIAPGPVEKISYHQFSIDKDLGLLVDNGNLRSRLFKLYLHALTSHCLPDSLTSRTGSEEALYGLKLASTRSFLSLDTEHVDLLKLFANLTPSRDYYPKSPKAPKLGQTVSWENLSPLSQYEAFATEARRMLIQAESFRAFQNNPDVKYKMGNRGAIELKGRAEKRSAIYRVHQFGAEAFNTLDDVDYAVARDSILNSPKEHEAAYISQMVDNWTNRLNPYSELFEHLKSKVGSLVLGAQPAFTFRFDKRWLEPQHAFLYEHWCSMQLFLSKSDATKDKYAIMVFLTNLAQSKWGNLPLVHTLLAFATVPGLRNIRPPAYSSFDLTKGFEPNNERLRRILNDCKGSASESPDHILQPIVGESDRDYFNRRQAAYQSESKKQVEKCLTALIRQWPSKTIACPQSTDIKTYLPHLRAKFAEIQELFENWFKNREFQNYIQDIQLELDSLSRPDPMHAPYSIPEQIDTYKRVRGHVQINDLLLNPAPEIESPEDELAKLWTANDHPVVDAGPSKLKSLLAKLSRTANGHYQKMYVKDLQKSHSALLANSSASPELSSGSLQTILKKHLEQQRENVESLYKRICAKLVPPGSSVYESARIASRLPRLSPSILLRLLARFSHIPVNAEWKTALTRYALAIAAMQRAERLVACGTRTTDILNELTNSGHANWDPMENPEWLLLELESNILIRPEQAQIAREMIAPQSGANSIMQLNMGLGKSSVIVPIVAATLADSTKLARVVVLKSLSAQMFQLLVSKLGGLIGRRIYRLPISRSLAPSLETSTLIFSTLQECMQNGGILLVEPESLLSFELLGIDHLLSRQLALPDPELDLVPEGQGPQEAERPSMYDIGKVMVKTQQWLYQNARDILDESDEILSVRFELIYTLGIQQNIQFSPDRWTIIQKVLGVLAEAAQDLVQEMPHGLEVIEGAAGAFPRIRILEEPAGKALLIKVAETICRSGMSSLAMWTFSPLEQQVIFEYLTNLQIPKARARILEEKAFATEFTKMTMLLLRGLFAAGVLEFVFAKKRWRVNYGLDLSRSMLAVPYHAKDNPSARSEFSHPDTAIALTCLSYYYGGLTDDQIRDSFEELLLSDHAQEDYVQWIRHCEDLPKRFKQLVGVNLRDKQQCSQELFPALRFSKGLIDYYLEHLVFPKEMKEFSNKLSSSGWELAREKTHPTTGFSGTNDSKYMLPTPIKQCDLSEQLSTNAEVLACLLQPENNYDTEYTPEVEALDVVALLDIAVEMVPPIRVLLDVGAQLLEDNERIASSWLSKAPEDDVSAVIYFHDNEIFVLNREGMKEPLLVSPFAKQMDRCLVYLDEAHTRGTDLKMPADYRAIVTLGPDLTKDRLAQACKRLRKLGKGQSVCFVAPLEVQTKILESSGKKDARDIEVEDVLLWTMRNSWDFTKKGMPLWATQGMRHYRRRAACDMSLEVPQIPVGILEPEALTLDERYGLDRQQPDEGIVCRNRLQVDSDVTRTEVCSIRAKCREFGLSSFGDSGLHEEQERELHPENEREQQVEPPPPSKPYKHILHDNIRALVRTGKLSSNEGTTRAFKAFSATRARHLLNGDEWPENLRISHDFYHTVEIPGESNKDSFLRPVNWILSFKDDSGPTYLVLSPFEVQELLPQMRAQNRVRLHVYSPRLSLSNRTLEDLAYCAVPPVPDDWTVPSISTTLNLFAGQLYVRDVAEYRTLCRFLGVRFQERFDGAEISTDGFISPETRAFQDDATAAICKFPRSPIDFLRLVTSFRRLGQTFATSHMGKILSGELVRSIDFEVIERIGEDDDDDAMDVDDDSIVVKPEPMVE